MNFSEPVTASSYSLAPCSTYIASTTHNKLIIRLSATLRSLQSRKCTSTIHSVSWSPDSRFILCVLKKQGTVQVFSMDDPEWLCSLDEGAMGLLSAEWAPDGLHILTTSDFFIRISVWSLAETCVSCLKYAKACSSNLAFSPGGRYLALLERQDFRDYLSLFDCANSWGLLRHTKLDTQDAAGLLWSPDGRYIVIWDECLRYRVNVCSADGRLLHTYCAYEPGQDLLGIKAVCWSPTGQLLALGSYDEKCRILNDINWACLATLAHPVDKPINPLLGLSPTGKPIQANADQSVGPGDTDAPLGYRPHRVDAYEEWCPSTKMPDSSAVPGCGKSSEASGVVYRLVDGPVTIRSVRPNPKLPFPKIGIGLMAFSTDGRFLATRNDNAQHAIWIWSIDHRLSLFSLLLHSSAVISFSWDPTYSARLALCTGSDTVFMWTPQGCLTVQTPPHFKFLVNSLVWFPTGDALLLKSDSQFSFCYLQPDQKNSPTKPQSTVWKPPPPSTVQTSALLKPLIDSPLPTGVFGDRSHETDGDSTGVDVLSDGPKWLRQHNRRPSVKTRDQRRSASSRNPLRVVPPNRPTSVVTITRQPWIPPTSAGNLQSDSTCDQA